MKRLILAGAALAALLAGPASAQDKILNASYDVARELFAKENAAFVPKYKAETGKDITVDQSHAGSSKQARAILEGLEADVVTFNQVTDIEFLVEERLRLRRLAERFPQQRLALLFAARPSWCAPATRRTSRTGTIWSATT